MSSGDVRLLLKQTPGVGTHAAGTLATTPHATAAPDVPARGRVARTSPAAEEGRIMTDYIPGAIINVRWGQYVDASGFLRDGRLHDHVCLYPGCKGLIPCTVQSVRRGDGDGGEWVCELFSLAPLCDDHADAEPCDDCGDYGHTSEQCPEAVSTEAGMETWDKTDFAEHFADAALQDEKDGR